MVLLEALEARAVAVLVEAGAVAVLAGLLGDGEAPELRREALKALKLIAAAGDSVAKQAVLAAGVLVHAAVLLAQPEQEASVLVASCGVISGVCTGGVAGHVEAVVEAKALGPLMRLLSEDKEGVRSAAAGALNAVMCTGVGWPREAIIGLAGEGCVDALCEALATVNAKACVTATVAPLVATPGAGAVACGTADLVWKPTPEPGSSEQLVSITAMVEGSQGIMSAEELRAADMGFDLNDSSPASWEQSVLDVALSALTKMLEGGGGDDTGSAMREVAALMEEAGVLSKLEQLQQQHLESGIRSNAALMLEQHGEAITGAAAARVPALVQQLRSGEELAKATKKLRKVLSVKTSPPVSRWLILYLRLFSNTAVAIALIAAIATLGSGGTHATYALTSDAEAPKWLVSFLTKVYDPRCIPY
jgi:hypothetical protein